MDLWLTSQTRVETLVRTSNVGKYSLHSTVGPFSSLEETRDRTPKTFWGSWRLTINCIAYSIQDASEIETRLPAFSWEANVDRIIFRCLFQLHNFIMIWCWRGVPINEWTRPSFAVLVNRTTHNSVSSATKSHSHTNHSECYSWRWPASSTVSYELPLLQMLASVSY